MRIFIRLLILFALAVGLAIGARFNPGNVVVFFPPYRIDLSLNLFLFSLVALFVVIYVFMGAIVTARKRSLHIVRVNANVMVTKRCEKRFGLCLKDASAMPKKRLFVLLSCRITSA